MHSLRKPEYTGQNRCWPCTAVNLAIAAALAVALASLSPALGAAAFAAGAAVVGYVGYLVPGTPTLTRRYLPEHVHSWFGTTPPEAPQVKTDGAGVPGTDGLDAGSDLLIERGVIEAHDNGTLSLSSSFEAAWADEIEALRDDCDAQRAALADLLEIDPDDVTIEPIDGTGALSVRVVDGGISQWISQAALIADGAAGWALSSVDPTWMELPVEKRHAALVGLRQFRDRCPACGGELESRPEDTAACCWTSTAVTARCVDCEDRLYVIAEHPE